MMHRILVFCAAAVFAVGAGFGVSLMAGSEAEAAPFRKVVDNSSKGFSAPGWKRSDYSRDRYGKNYRVAGRFRNGEPAKFRVRLPRDGRYTVYARWPASKGYNASTRIGVGAMGGFKWRSINQRHNGGEWVKIGTHKMRKGTRYRVMVSRRSDSKGYVIADAVKFVRAKRKAGNSGGTGSRRTNGYDVLREAKSWLGTPYRYGGISRGGVDCSGLSLKVYDGIGVNLPRTAAEQFHNGPGKKVSGFGRGNLVFGHADGGKGIEHVGIATGDGRMIHAPYPGTVVRYAEIPAGWYNVVGVKRIVPNG